MIRIFWLVGVIGLFLYSFTQIDLALTLSQPSLVQSVEKSFQFIGYFNRPLSTQLYITILFVLFAGYISFLTKAYKNKLSENLLMKMIIITAGILVFTYSAFSYDIFNYMFGAKEIVQYHANPYVIPPWDFKTDHMIPFMRNIDKVYVYGPFSLVLTIPLTILGFGSLLPTFYLYKLLSAVAYVGTCYMIYKILKKFAPERAIVGTAFFAFNPLVIIESLVSAHNDIWMMFLAIVALWFLLSKKYIFAYLFLILSVLTKQVTVFLLPIFIFITIVGARVKKYLLFSIIIFSCISAQLVGGWFVLQQRELQPWYFLWVLPLIALLPRNTIIYTFTTGLSLAFLCKYVLYVRDGNWEHIMAFWAPLMTMISVLSVMIGILLWFFERRKHTTSR